MKAMHSVLFATALVAATTVAAFGQPSNDTIAVPVLRANVTVTGSIVRIGDLIDNAGTAAQIAVYRSPDLGTTGSLPASQVLTALRAHDVIGVDTKNIKQVTVTRLARIIKASAIQDAVSHALAHRGGLGDAANLSLTFDRGLQDLRLDASNTGTMEPSAVQYDLRTGRFDVTFDLVNDTLATPTRLRFTGTCIETVEAAVLTRNVERTEILRSSDVMVERRPKAEVGNDAAVRDQVVGMQMRHPMRAGQPLHVADLAKPDLVQRDQSVTMVFQSSGIYLTSRGKALDNGTEGDVVSVVNLQSKRTVTGIVTGRGQVTIQIATPKPVYVADTAPIQPDEARTALSLAETAGNTPATPKPE